MSQVKRWCFTINNPTPNDEERLRVLGSTGNVSYLVFGREVGESGTPHLQGFVVYSRSVRFTTCKNRIGDTAHIEVARGTSQQAADYCKKDGDFVEIGELPTEQGKRSDWDNYKQFVAELGRVPNEREVIQHNPSLFARYKGACYQIARAFLPEPKFTDSEPRLGWQTLVAGRMASENPNRRSIDFVVDPEGNSGKSWMCQYALTVHPESVQVLRVGRRDDLAYAIDETKTKFLFDVPRGQMEFFQYSVVEMIKDRMIFSAKYQSGMKVLPSVPYVAVFSNEEPNMDALTGDRYNIINV